MWHTFEKNRFKQFILGNYSSFKMEALELKRSPRFPYGKQINCSCHDIILFACQTRMLMSLKEKRTKQAKPETL